MIISRGPPPYCSPPKSIHTQIRTAAGSFRETRFLFFHGKKSLPKSTETYRCLFIAAVSAPYNIGRTPATLVCALIRCRLLTLWHLWMFQGSSFSLYSNLAWRETSDKFIIPFFFPHCHCFSDFFEKIFCTAGGFFLFYSLFYGIMKKDIGFSYRISKKSEVVL